eukprot:6314311-Ditylum_brightwellii.AAC.1
MDVEVCCVVASTEGTMPKPKTSGDVSICSVLSLQDSGVVTFISHSDYSLSAVDEAGRAVACATSTVDFLPT